MPPPPPNAPPQTLPEGTSVTPIPPPPAFPTASDCPPNRLYSAPQPLCNRSEFAPRAPSPSSKPLVHPRPLLGQRVGGGQRPQKSLCAPKGRPSSGPFEEFLSFFPEDKFSDVGGWVGGWVGLLGVGRHPKGPPPPRPGGGGGMAWQTRLDQNLEIKPKSKRLSFWQKRLISEKKLISVRK